MATGASRLSWFSLTTESCRTRHRSASILRQAHLLSCMHYIPGCKSLCSLLKSASNLDYGTDGNQVAGLEAFVYPRPAVLPWCGMSEDGKLSGLYVSRVDPRISFLYWSTIRGDRTFWDAALTPDSSMFLRRKICFPYLLLVAWRRSCLAAKLSLDELPCTPHSCRV